VVGNQRFEAVLPPWTNGDCFNMLKFVKLVPFVQEKASMLR